MTKEEVYMLFVRAINPYAMNVKDWNKVWKKRDVKKIEDIMEFFDKNKIDPKEYFLFCKRKFRRFNYNMINSEKCKEAFILKKNNALLLLKFHIPKAYEVVKRLWKIYHTSIFKLLKQESHWLAELYNHKFIKSFVILFFPYINWEDIYKNQYIDFINQKEINNLKFQSSKIYNKIKTLLLYKKFIERIKNEEEDQLQF